MKIQKNKNKNAIVVCLVLAFAVTLIALPIGNAHTPPWTVPTTAYVSAAPSRIAIGQSTTIVVWVDRYSPTAGGGIGQRSYG